MNPIRLTVSQVRVAASCPRIAYFDAQHTRRKKLDRPSVTRIWKVGKSDGITALGALFHRSVEHFNRHAGKCPQVREAVAQCEGATPLSQALLGVLYRDHVNHDKLFLAEGPSQQAFMQALTCYVEEVAQLMAYGLDQGVTADELLDQMFGDDRRRVDVTFDVGPSGEKINVYGILDYVFYDWRSSRKRIIDYKLTPSETPASDLYQVSLYGLMHHQQHHTEPDIAVLYLYPKRQMVEKKWEEIYADRHRLFDFLASLREWVDYDEEHGRGLKPPGEPIYCSTCRWEKECIGRLGPKNEGDRLSHWTQPAKADQEPFVSVQVPQPQDEPEFIDEEDELAAEEAVQDGAQSTPAAEEALQIGAVLDGGFPVAIPAGVLPTHVTVVGAAGSGKTWLAKVLVEEAVTQKIPVIAVDPQGDLVQFLNQQERQLFTGEELAAYESFCSLVEPRVYTPGTSHGIRLALNPTRLASPAELARIENPARRAEEERDMLSAAASNLVSLAKIGGEEDTQRTFLYMILRALTQDVADVNLNDITAALYSPESVGVPDADMYIKKSEREKLARKLNNFIIGPSAGLFSGGRSLDLDEMIRPSSQGRVPLNVIYLNALTDDDEKQFFVASLAAEIYRWMVTSLESSGRPNLLFYLDEARDYIPATKKPAAKEPLIRLFTQGRKYGVSCLLCTQSPRSVDYNVFGNCSTKIIGRMESAQDLERIADWFKTTGPAPSWIHERKGAGKGTFVARWPGMPSEVDGQVFQSRKLFSQHEGAWSPDRLEREMEQIRS